MPNEPINQHAAFDLGQEIGHIKGGVDLLLERTEDLKQIREMVHSHQRFISGAKKVGWWIGTPLLGTLLAVVKAKWKLLFGHP